MFLMIPVAFILMSIGEQSHSSISPSTAGDPMAVLCSNPSEETIDKSNLLKCGGLKLIDAKTHQETDYQITSYEVIFFQKNQDPKIIENAAAPFNSEVREDIAQLWSGDKIIFRRIKAKGTESYVKSMNTIVLTLQ